MPNTTGGARAICPYYARDDVLSINCAGVCNAQHIMRFSRKEDKQAYMDQFCETWEYWACPMCDAIDGWFIREDPE